MKLHNPFETDKPSVILSTVSSIFFLVVGFLFLSYYFPWILLLIPLVPFGRLVWYVLKGK